MKNITLITLITILLSLSPVSRAELCLDFKSTVIVTPTPSTYKPYQAQVDDTNRSMILLSVVAPNSAPAEFGTIDLNNNYAYTTLYGDVTKGNTEGIVDGIGKAARIREIRCFTQNGNTVYFGDRYVIRKIDRNSGNVTTVLGDPSVNVDNFTSWDTATFDNINGIIYDNGILYVNTDTVGLVMFNLAQQTIKVAVPLAQISSPDSNDYGADLFISPDRKLCMKVSQGVNRYDLSELDQGMTSEQFVNARWVSSIDRTAQHLEQNYTFGSTFFGRLGLSLDEKWLSMVDLERKYIYFINVTSGEVERICGSGPFRDGNTSVCSFTEPYSSVWIRDEPNNNKNHNGTLYIFHYYSASGTDRKNYIAKIKFCDTPVPPSPDSGCDKICIMVIVMVSSVMMIVAVFTCIICCWRQNQYNNQNEHRRCCECCE